MKVHPYLHFLKIALNYVLFADLIVGCARKSVKHLDGHNSSFLAKHHQLDVVTLSHPEDIMYIFFSFCLFFCVRIASLDLHHSHH